jgi:hypothetical protein
LTLDVSRAVRETLSSHLGGVTASVSFVDGASPP